MASRLFSFSQRMKFIEKYQKIYHSANRKTRSGIIKLISETLGYHPKHIIRLLNNFEFSGDTDKTYKISGRGKKAEYNGIRDVIISLWNEVGCIWAERLKVFITENISWITEKYDLNQTQILLLNKISPSTIDRIVKHQRIRRKKYLFSRTRPGSLLRREIPVIIEVCNDIRKPGHIQIDLVAHCGNSISGEFNWTLNATDIYSQWSESECIVNKSEYEVIDALKNIISRMPFNIISINSDNGSEFINWELLRYCKNNNILFSRTRPYKKDDNAYIEQKNWTNVRKIIGFDRYEGKKAKDLLNDLYRNELRLFLNLFMPSVKRIEIKQEGSKYRRIYDKPKTPINRLIELYPNNPEVKKITELKNKINPFELISEINRKLKIIWDNRCKKVIKDANYLKQKEILENVEKLLKKEAGSGNINYDGTIH